MFWRRYIVNKTNLYRNLITEAIVCNGRTVLQYKSYSRFTTQLQDKYGHIYKNYRLHTACPYFLHRKCHTKGTLDGIFTLAQNTQEENDLKKITELFPQPRVTLNELIAKTPQKIFDVQYRMHSAPKVSRKKMVQGEWHCTYAFVWPEKIKFESTAISKRQAAEKAAAQALQYLYNCKRIDSKGRPIYDKDVIAELHSSLNEPISLEISEASMERVERIWNDYESGIKDIYERTFKEAKDKMASKLRPAALTKDSTIDDEDEFSEGETDIDCDDFITSDPKTYVHPVYGRHISSPSEATLQRLDKILRQKFERYDEELTPLPIDQYADEITSTLENSRVAVIVGAAGCGKSTRVPAAILRKNGAKTNAIVSEPRRVAAIGLADRVASELGEETGDAVGFQVRLHAKHPRPPSGSILYCTSGVLLRRLHSNPGLLSCSHVFIDEAHERDVNTDVTLLLLRRAMALNPELKVVVMSATLDTEVFTRYFDSCPVIEVPGRTFPVEVSYLDDIQKKFGIRLPNTMESCQKEGRPQLSCEEVVEVIKAVDVNEAEGAILVFLPGWAEIKLTNKLLAAQFGEQSTHLILPVHSRLSTADQTKMFAKPLPGVRKIVLATNIAETSITIPDVVYVIDTGAHKENRIIEKTGTASLETVWVSQAGAKQRTGRAGRVQPGHCYRMYTKEKEADFATHTTPEILRIPLDQTVLDCKTYAPEEKAEEFLSQLPEPPSRKAIRFAVNDLIDIGALYPSEQPTHLGLLLSRLSLPPRLALVMIHAAGCGSVLPAAVLAVHLAANVEVFGDSGDRRDEIREIKREFSPTSDHAALYWIQMEYERVLKEKGRKGAEEWCEKYGMRRDRLNYVKSLSDLHIEQILKSGVVEPTIEADELNRFADVDELTAAILLSGSNSLLKTKRYVKTKGKLMTVVELFTSQGDRAHIASESVNHGITKRGAHHLVAHWGGFHSAERRALVVHKASLVSPHASLLFCKGDVARDQFDGDKDTTILNLQRHKLLMHVPTSQADHLLKAREMLWNTFQYYIERDVKTLDYEENITISRFKIRLFKALGRILVEAGNDKTVEDFR